MSEMLPSILVCSRLEPKFKIRNLKACEVC
jgi:hypothetical protein